MNQITNAMSFFDENIRHLDVKELGIINLLELNKFLKKCLEQHSVVRDTYAQIVQNNTATLMKANEDKKDALNFLFFGGILVNLQKTNDYINANETLKPLIPELQEIIANINESVAVLAEKEYELDFKVNSTNLTQAIEKADLKADKVLSIEFLL